MRRLITSLHEARQEFSSLHLANEATHLFTTHERIWEREGEGGVQGNVIQGSVKGGKVKGWLSQKKQSTRPGVHRCQGESREDDSREGQGIVTRACGLVCAATDTVEASRALAPCRLAGPRWAVGAGRCCSPLSSWSVCFWDSGWTSPLVDRGCRMSHMTTALEPPPFG